MLERARFIAGRDLWLMLRQKETLLWVFLMPVVFFYFIGTVTSGFGKSRSSKDRIEVESGANAGFLGESIEQRLASSGYEVVRPAEGADDRPSVRLTIPEELTARVLAGEQQQVLLASDEEGERARYHELKVGRAIYGVLADVVAAKSRGEEASLASFAALAAQPRNLKIDVSAAGKRKVIPSGFDQAIPGTMVMFTLIVLLTSGAVLLLIEREQGLLRRLASAPLSRGEIVLGKWGARMALGLVQIAFALVLGRFLFRVDWGPDIPMVALVLLGWASLCASLALLLGSLARTPGQAIGIGVLASNVLAALGGCWWPIEITPRWMQSLAMFLPTGWTMDALHRLVIFQHGALSALPHVTALVLAALATGWAAARAFRFQ